MSAWTKATIKEQIQSGTVDQLSIGDIARLIANDDANLEIELIREMSEDYLAMRLRAHGDNLHGLARVLYSGWFDGVWRKAGALIFVTQEQYTPNQSYLQIEQSPCFPEFMIKREDFRDYLTRKPPLPKDCILAEWIDDKTNSQNLARTEHVINWVKRKNYTGGSPDKVIIGELQKEKPNLWGKNDATFRKWIQTDEATPAIEVLPNKRRRK